MKTISDNLKNSLARKTPIYKKTVYLYKRFWNGGAYVYDAPIDITDEVKEYGDLLWKLDNEGFNVWNLSNTTLVLRNDRNQWLEGNTKGFFTANYLINQSKIKIKVGAELADGSIEDLYAFSGYISDSPNYDTENKKAIITLISAMSALNKTSALDLTNTYTEEVIGRFTGITFETKNKGVAEIVKVEKKDYYSGSIYYTLIPEREYSFSNLNKKELRATITLVRELQGTEYVRATYKCWYYDKFIEEIIEEFITNIGITDYSISQILFNLAVKIYNDQKTTYFLKTGEKSNVDIYSTDGQIRLGLPVFDDFSDGDITTNPTWTEVGASSFFDSIYDRKYRFRGDATEIYTSDNNTTGTWEIVYSADGGIYFTYQFIVKDNWYNSGQGYKLTIDQNSDEITLWKDASSIIGRKTSAGITGYDMHLIRITRDASGNFIVYLDDISIITGTENTYNTNYFYRLICNGSTIENFFNINYMGYSDSVIPAGQYVATGNFISEVFDCSENVTSYDQLFYDNSTPANTSITVETYSSDTSDFSTGNDAAGWVAVSDYLVPQSALKRYIKFRFTLATTDSAATPLISNIVFYYSSKQVKLEIASLSGSYLDMIKEFAKISNYEIAFDTNDKFYFRSRTSIAGSVLDIKGDDNLKELTNYSQGIERVYNIVTASIGNYTETSSAEDDSVPNSVTKYGKRCYDISSSLMITDNMNISLGIAPTILAYTKTPRKRCDIETQFLPQLELGDKITLFYEEPTALRLWKWGDTDVVYGQADIEYYNNEVLQNRYNFWDIDMRIEGIRLNLNNYITNFDLVQVL